ncbi:MAG: hypothetical protein V4510_01725 [bacterium]
MRLGVALACLLLAGCATPPDRLPLAQACEDCHGRGADFWLQGCTAIDAAYSVDAAAVRSRLPPGYSLRSYDPTTENVYPVSTRFGECKSAALDNATVLETVRIVMTFVAVVAPPDASRPPDLFLLEGYVDNALLAARWGELGFNVQQATIDRSADSALAHWSVQDTAGGSLDLRLGGVTARHNTASADWRMHGQGLGLAGAFDSSTREGVGDVSLAGSLQGTLPNTVAAAPAGMAPVAAYSVDADYHWIFVSEENA